MPFNPPAALFPISPALHSLPTARPAETGPTTARKQEYHTSRSRPPQQGAVGVKPAGGSTVVHCLATEGCCRVWDGWTPGVGRLRVNLRGHGLFVCEKKQCKCLLVGDARLQANHLGSLGVPQVSVRAANCRARVLRTCAHQVCVSPAKRNACTERKST